MLESLCYIQFDTIYLLLVTHHISGLLAFAKRYDAVDHILCVSIDVEISTNGPH